MQELDELIRESSRIMTICNACRYCEGYCAVFPAMERRLDFQAADLEYLANLCHNCGECLHACQYAPPHTFAVNVPQTLAQLRNRSWQRYAAPSAWAGAFAGGARWTVALTLLLLVLGGLALFAVRGDALWQAQPGGDFYQLLPHAAMAWSFGLVALAGLAALGLGAGRAWAAWGETAGAGWPQWRQALADAISLKYLHGGGGGCHAPAPRWGHARRWLHHLCAGGFLLCFAATSVATVEHTWLGRPAPYPLLSLPVLLGSVGGVALLVGSLGLLGVKLRRSPDLGDESRAGTDLALIGLLAAVAASGLALLALRTTALLGAMLVLHLALVMTLFALLPYGKFVHGLYRTAALLKYALEQTRPGVNVGGDA